MLKISQQGEEVLIKSSARRSDDLKTFFQLKYFLSKLPDLVLQIPRRSLWATEHIWWVAASKMNVAPKGTEYITKCVSLNKLKFHFVSVIFQVLVSGDESGLINIWSLKDKGLKLLRSIDPFGEFPVTCLSLWNKIWHGNPFF